MTIEQRTKCFGLVEIRKTLGPGATDTFVDHPKKGVSRTRKIEVLNTDCIRATITGYSFSSSPPTNYDLLQPPPERLISSDYINKEGLKSSRFGIIKREIVWRDTV